MGKRLIKYCVIFVLGFLLINLITHTHIALIRIEEPGLEERVYKILGLYIYGALMGILIEWKKLIKIIKGRLNVNIALLVAALILLTLGIIPNAYYYIWFGVGEIYGIGMTNWFLQPLRFSIAHIVITILAGVLLVRSLSDD